MLHSKSEASPSWNDRKSAAVLAAALFADGNPESKRYVIVEIVKVALRQGRPEQGISEDRMQGAFRRTPSRCLIQRIGHRRIKLDVERELVQLGDMDHHGASFLWLRKHLRSEEHTSELQSLMRISYAVFCLKKKI